MSNGLPTGLSVTPRRDLQSDPSVEDLQRLFDLSVQMLCIAGIDGYFKRINPAFETTLGYSREELLSRPFIEFVHPDDREATLAELSRLTDGIPTIHFENRYRCRDGSYRWLAWTSTPSKEDNLVYATAMDVTNRRETEEKIATNLHIEAALGSILRACLEPVSLDEQLERCLDELISVPWIALKACGAIFLVAEDPEVLVLKAHLGLPAELQSICREVPLGKCLCGRAGAMRRIEFAHCVDVRHETRCEGMPAHGHYCIPIVTGEELHGVLNLYVEPGHKRTAEEERFLCSVADILAGAIKRWRTEVILNARDAELIAAEKIQQHLLPASPPATPGFDIWGALYPAEFVAGDIFDYFSLCDGSIVLVIGDVSGHGVSSALLMASVCARLRALTEWIAPLDAVLDRLNAALCRESEEGKFVTLVLGQLDPQTKTLAYTSAGHPAGIVLDHYGNVKAELTSTSLPLGVLPDAEFPTGNSVVLQSGDTVVLLTDGVLEATSSDNACFGSRQALDTVRANIDRSAREIVECLHRAVCEFTNRKKPLDDVTIVVIKASRD